MEIKVGMPRYTNFSIINEIKKLEKIDLEKFNILTENENEILEQMKKNPSVFTKDMYILASKLLEKSLEELIAVDYYEEKPAYRKKSKEVDFKIFNFINSIFDEIIWINKIEGEK